MGDEHRGWSERWEIFETDIGPWWSIFFHFLILSPSRSSYRKRKRKYIFTQDGGKIKRKRTSITTVRELYRIFATFLTHLVSHWSLPLRELNWTKIYLKGRFSADGDQDKENFCWWTVSSHHLGGCKVLLWAIWKGNFFLLFLFVLHTIFLVLRFLYHESSINSQ